MTMDIISWFADIGLADAPTVGGKGANLGELVQAGLPVPPGFVVTAQAYLSSMDAAGVRSELSGAPELGSGTDATAVAAADAAHRRDLVDSGGMSPEVRAAVVAAYDELCRRAGVDELPVAVRSSATAEDAGDTSFAGMHETFTNVRGGDAVCARVVDCWRSGFQDRAFTYRAMQRVDTEPAIAVVVQQMAPAARGRSGVRSGRGGGGWSGGARHLCGAARAARRGGGTYRSADPCHRVRPRRQ
jgi:pyruvate,water dikinase